MPLLTRADAQALQEEARATGHWIMWFVAITDPDHPGQAVAWAITADPHGGSLQPGVLIAETLAELRTMLPAGLTRRERAAVSRRTVQAVQASRLGE